MELLFFNSWSKFHQVVHYLPPHYTISHMSGNLHMVEMDLDGEEEFKNTEMRIEYTRMAF